MFLKSNFIVVLTRAIQGRRVVLNYTLFTIYNKKGTIMNDRELYQQEKQAILDEYEEDLKELKDTA